MPHLIIWLPDINKLQWLQGAQVTALQKLEAMVLGSGYKGYTGYPLQW